MPHVKINQPGETIYGTTVEIDGELIHDVKSIRYDSSVNSGETPVVTLGIRSKTGTLLDIENANIVVRPYTLGETIKAILGDGELRCDFSESIVSVLEENEELKDWDIQKFYDVAGKILDKLININLENLEKGRIIL